jgi:hypothetical protein
MKIPMRFVELHSPLFLNGCNLQTKLDTIRKTDLQLVYDDEKHQLIVVYKGKGCFIPEAACASLEPIDQSHLGLDVDFKAPKLVKAQAPATGKPIRAQVSAPNGIKID